MAMQVESGSTSRPSATSDGPRQGIDWVANRGPQTRFLATSAYEALYGGAAGGGKSEALLIGALRHVDLKHYRAILFRRTYPELERSLIERSRELYPSLGAVYNDQKKVWSFPSGARIYFGHLEHEHSVYQHQSAEYQYIAFDELTHFTARQYRYMLSRGRSSKGIPIRIRAATNPGGEGHEWVFEYWAPWLNPESAVRARSGEVLYYQISPGGVVWCSKGEHTLSRVFVAAGVDDTPQITSQYKQQLDLLDPVTRAQLKHGDWLIKPAKGLYFKREWFEFVDAPPAEIVARVRYWDRAATEGAGDYTVGCKVSLGRDRKIYVEDIVRDRKSPGGVEELIRATATADGVATGIVLEEDPGQAGKFESAYYVREMMGFNVRALRKHADKLTTAQPFSAQCEAGNVRVVRGRWSDAFIQELEAFPEGDHDDQVDAAAGAFRALVSAPVSAGVRKVRSLGPGIYG